MWVPVGVCQTAFSPILVRCVNGCNTSLPGWCGRRHSRFVQKILTVRIFVTGPYIRTSSQHTGHYYNGPGHGLKAGQQYNTEPYYETLLKEFIIFTMYPQWFYLTLAKSTYHENGKKTSSLYNALLLFLTTPLETKIFLLRVFISLFSLVKSLLSKHVYVYAIIKMIKTVFVLFKKKNKIKEFLRIVFLC